MLQPIYSAVYPAIDATQPQLTQHGKTVFITGGGSGIGFVIARQFAVAGASRIILIGRRSEKLLDAKEHLTSKVPSFQGGVDTYTCDIGDTNKVEELWEDLKRQGIIVDVLILNAIYVGTPQAMFAKGWRDVWMHYEMNVRANMVLTDSFVKQTENTDSKRYLINISSNSIYDYQYTEEYRLYACTKSSFTCFLQHLAHEVSVDKIQVINFHPGVLYTESSSQMAPKDAYNWDDESLPANYAVWAATDEASFMHGRFAWAGWGVEELKTVLERDGLLESPDFLKVGVTGLEQPIPPYVGAPEHSHRA